MGKRILILDDPLRDMVHLSKAFEKVTNGKSLIEVVRNREALFQSLKAREWDLVVIDNVLEGNEFGGLEVLSSIQKEHPNLMVVVVVGEDNIQFGATLVAAGAADFLVESDKILIDTQIKKIGRLMELIRRNRSLTRQYRQLHDAEQSRHRMIGDSPQIRAIFDKINRVAKIPRPILITGPRGTGKELVARAIHDAAGPPERPIVVVNCAAFSDELLDSTLFGHEKGSFTGASKRFFGKFEQAAGGTLFLDEIGNMSLAFQQKIMRVVEYGSFRRVGGSADITVDTRVLAATNADLKKRMERGAFLRDLYDRLTFEIIDLPPLRERGGDIQLLAQHFLERFMEEIPDFQGKRLSSQALRALEKYAFPGNIRELKNIIERAVYRDTTQEITVEDLEMYEPLAEAADVGDFKERVEAFELRLVKRAMAKSRGKQAAAAKALGLSYHQLRYYLKKYEGRV